MSTQTHTISLTRGFRVHCKPTQQGQAESSPILDIRIRQCISILLTITLPLPPQKHFHWLCKNPTTYSSLNIRGPVSLVATPISLVATPMVIISQKPTAKQSKLTTACLTWKNWRMYHCYCFGTIM